ATDPSAAGSAGAGLHPLSSSEHLPECAPQQPPPVQQRAQDQPFLTPGETQPGLAVDDTAQAPAGQLLDAPDPPPDLPGFGVTANRRLGLRGARVAPLVSPPRPPVADPAL